MKKFALELAAKRNHSSVCVYFDIPPSAWQLRSTSFAAILPTRFVLCLPVSVISFARRRVLFSITISRKNAQKTYDKMNHGKGKLFSFNIIYRKVKQSPQNHTKIFLNPIKYLITFTYKYAGKMFLLKKMNNNQVSCISRELFRHSLPLSFPTIHSFIRSFIRLFVHSVFFVFACSWPKVVIVLFIWLPWSFRC